jgi:uridine kinase
MKNKPYVIGIAGGSGSGKTFFLNCFLNHFRTDEICLISQDDYYIPVGELTQEQNKLHNFDLPNAIDDKQFFTDIQKILNGETIYKKAYKFNKKNAEQEILEIKPASILIIEGLFILHYPEIASLLNLKIFIQAQEEVALQRRIKRDFIERGYSENDVRYKWNNHVLPSYNEYLLPYKTLADKIIDNNLNIADQIIKTTAEISRELKVNIERM